MNKILFTFLVLVGCASAQEKYVENIKVRQTSDICNQLEEIEKLSGIASTDSPNTRLQKLSQASGQKNFLSYFPKYFYVKQKFCSDERYFFIENSGNIGRDCTNCHPVIWFSKTREIDLINQNYKYERSLPYYHIFTPSLFSKIDGLKQQISGNKSSYIDSFKTASLDQPFKFSVVKRYPEFKGLLKTEAKANRKSFLQDNVKKQMDMVDQIAIHSTAISSFLDEWLPGPYNQATLEPRSKKVYAELGKFDIKPDCGPCDAFTPPHLHYYPDYPENRTRFLKKLVEDRNLRGQIFSHLMKSYTTITVKRMNKDEIEITTVVDIPKVRQNFKFQKISELIEQ